MVKVLPVGETSRSDRGGAASGEEAVEAFEPRLRDCINDRPRPCVAGETMLK